MKRFTNLLFALALVTSFAVGSLSAGNVEKTSLEVRKTKHKTIKVNGLDIFYREAGPEHAPTILLLHGFPTSSHMFRDFIPQLSDRYHVIAPDYPGFGYSSAPSGDEFEYTFDNLAKVIDKFTNQRPDLSIGGCLPLPT